MTMSTEVQPHFAHENSAPKASDVDGPVLELPQEGHFSGTISCDDIADDLFHPGFSSGETLPAIVA